MPPIVDPTTATLAWDAGAGGGAVDHFTVSNGVNQYNVPATQTTYALSGFPIWTPGQQYSLTVTAVNAAGSVASAPLAIQIVQPLQPPAAPVNLRIQ